MTYLDLAAALVSRLEACKLVGYLDSGGVPTDGYGHTGPEVKVGRTITQEIADHNRTVDLATADHRLAQVCYPSSLDKLQQHERAALVSFVFNVGAEPGWEIWKDIDTGDLADVPTQLRRFDKAKVKGKLVAIKGLDNRRDAECAFWNTADIEVAAVLARPAGPGSGVDLAPPSHATVAMITPPEPAPAPPLAHTSLAAKLTTVAGGAVAAAASQAQQVHGVISPYVDNAKLFGTLDTIAVGVIVAAGVIGVLIHAHQAEVRKT